MREEIVKKYGHELLQTATLCAAQLCRQVGNPKSVVKKSYELAFLLLEERLKLEKGDG